jgi:AcrR family transcriptional regulator
MYQAVHVRKQAGREELLRRCLNAFVKAGTIDLSLDRLAKSVGISKRMLIHYFETREAIEQEAMSLLEEMLRAQFAPESFPAGVSPEKVVTLLWQRATAPKAKGVLLLIMDLSKRAWNGSARAKAFYAEQQRLWVKLLAAYLPNNSEVEELLQLFQGAVLAYLITGDPDPGLRSLLRLLGDRRNPASNSGRRSKPDVRKSQKKSHG